MGLWITRASIMRDVQRERRGRSMGVSDGICGMTLPLHLGGSVQHSQSPIDADTGWGDDGTSMRLRVPRLWSILLTFQKN
jgi:hypothetical protein